MPSNHDSITSEVDVATRPERAGVFTAPPSRSLTAALQSVRVEVQRLDAIRELLEFAETDWAEQQDSMRSDIERLERKRHRLAFHITRFRNRRRAVRRLRRDPSDPSLTSDCDPLAQREQLAETMAMLETTRDSLRQAESDHRRQNEEWAEQARCQAEELARAREQCEQLKDQLSAEMAAREAASSQARGPAGGSASDDIRRAPAQRDAPASMSWEQRKAAMLEQLQREDDADLYTPHEKTALRDMIEKSDREIQDRDAEIAELRQLLEAQSTTLGSAHQGGVDEPVAMGAAAFAHMFDADDMIREEREKLKEIRREWEEKLRHSEIELSLERAKLARGRRELEQKQADLEEQLFRISKRATSEADSSAAQQPQRRWLKQLGLGEGS